MIPNKTHAIQTALAGDWEKAITLNLALLESDPTDIETLNRLGYAFTVLGKFKDAKSTYKKVLEIDSKNPIALKNLKKLSDAHRGDDGEPVASEIPVLSLWKLSDMFLEEGGKTKIIELVNVAEPKIVSALRTGEYITLQIKRLKIFAHDNHKQFIGMLPDDIGKRLIEFISGGNTYEAYVKSVDEHKVSIFVRETKRATRFKNQPSFPQAGGKKLSSSKASHKQESDKQDNEEPEPPEEG